MRRPTILLVFVFAALLPLTAPVSTPAQSVPRFPIADSPIQLEGLARPGVYLGGPGREAAFFGRETGEFEAWGWPVKLLHDFRLSFKVPEYDEPIPGTSVAKRVIVRPEMMMVIYSHASFTVREIVADPPVPDRAHWPARRSDEESGRRGGVVIGVPGFADLVVRVLRR